MKTLGDRLRATREEQGLTQKGLAELSTTPQQVISKIETGATQESRHVIRLALALHVRPEWLAEGKGRKALDASTDENLGNTHAVTPRSRVPVISWVSAGNWSEAFDPYAPGNAARWEELTERVNTLAFALEVRGDSMVGQAGQTSFPDGCLIVVDPTRKPKPGDFVVVRNNDWDEATFKQLVVDGGIKLLKPLNPQYPTRQVGPGTVMVGVVVLKVEKQRF